MGGRRQPAPSAWRLALLPLTPLYWGAVHLRAALYRRGTLRPARLGAPVVSVGNLTFGGTGKTPTVLALVRDLVRRGRHPAVLTRGYGRADTGAPLVLVGPEPEATAAEAGDEPVEMARRLPGVPVVVDRLRSRGGAEALRRGADVLVLDDGFQHLPLYRNLDLVLLDAGDPWGGGHLPPLGRLREPPSALRRADAVLLTKVPEEGSAAVDAIRHRVERLAPGAPVLEARLEVRRLRTPDGILTPQALAGRRVLPFAGVGRPAAFSELLASCGAEVTQPHWFPDHHHYSPGELDGVLEAARRLDATAVTTGKDAVKLPPDAPLWVVEVEMTPRSGSWDELWALCPGLLA